MRTAHGKAGDGGVRRSDARSTRNGAAQTTLDALIQSFRENGIEAFGQTHNDIRLEDLSPRQVDNLIVRLHRIRDRYPKITDDLLMMLGELL